MRIGVLGGSGSVGMGAVCAVCENGRHEVFLGYRNENKVRQSELAECVVPRQVEVFNEASLGEFCQDCDVVINCTGPASVIKDTVGRTCMKLGVPCVDVSGGSMLKTALAECLKSYPGGSCVIGAGIYPGLTELFADYAVRSNDRTKELKLYFRGNSRLSFVGAYDIVAGMERREGAGMSFCHNGRVEKITEKMETALTMPDGSESVSLLPVLGEEFCKAAEKNQVEKAYFYHTFSDGETMMQFLMIRALEQYKTEEQKAQSAEKIRKLFFTPERQEGVTLIADSTFLQNGEIQKKRKVLTCQEDWNTLTGYVAGYTAIELCGNKEKSTGVYYAAEAVDSEKIIDALVQNGHITVNNQ